MIRRVLHYFSRFIVSPGAASEEIARDQSGLRAGLWWVVIFCLCYSGTVLLLYLLGWAPGLQPLLTIPPERWYLVQTFTTLPIGLAGFLAYSGLAYLLGKWVQGVGSFDQTVASQAFTIHIPTFIFMWIPDTFVIPIVVAPGAALPWPAWLETLRVFAIPFTWMFIISTVALSRVHRIAWWKSLIIVVVAFIPTAGIMAVFIR